VIGLDRLSSHDLYIRALADANEELGRANTSLALMNQRLTVRSRYFTALNEMNRRLAAGVTHGEVCAAAAEATRAALELPGAGVFFFSGGPKLPPRRARGAGRRAACALDGMGRGLVSDAGGVGSAAGPVAGVSFLPVRWRRRHWPSGSRKAGGRPLAWLCPVIQDGHGFAGVLLPGGPAAPSQWAGESEELAALLAAIRLSLADAEARSNAERLER